MAVLTVLNILIYYHATYFAIIPSVLPALRFDITLHFNTIMVGVGKVRNFCAHVEVIEVNLIGFIFKFKKKHEHVQVKLSLMCYPLEQLHSSRNNCKYIISRRERPPEIRPPCSCRIFSSYPYVFP